MYPFNFQMVGMRGDTVTVSNPTNMMTPDQAMMHAAWVVTIAEVCDPELEGKFNEYLEAVKST